MFGSYRQVIGTYHARSTFGFGLIGRLPAAMNTVAIIFLVSNVRNSFALAGVVSSCYTLANAVASPRIGRLADRIGPRAVLIPVTLINIVFSFAVLYFSNKAAILLVISAILMGASFPGIGSFTRSRWSLTLKDQKVLDSALSLESVLDETGFVIGPSLAGFLFSIYGPKSPLIGAIVFLLVGGCGIALTSIEHIPHPPQEGKRGGLFRIKYMRPLLAALVCLGTVFGAQFVVILAVAKGAGRAAEGGLWVGLNPIGSILSGFIYGLIHWKFSAAKRFTVSLMFMTLATTGLVLFQNIDAIVYLLIFAGFGIGPALISANARIKELVPERRLNEGFALLGASLSIGITIGSTLSGIIVAGNDGWRGFGFMLGATALGTVVSLFGVTGKKT